MPSAPALDGHTVFQDRRVLFTGDLFRVEHGSVSNRCPGTSTRINRRSNTRSPCSKSSSFDSRVKGAAGTSYTRFPGHTAADFAAATHDWQVTLGWDLFGVAQLRAHFSIRRSLEHDPLPCWSLASQQALSNARIWESHLNCLPCSPSLSLPLAQIRLHFLALAQIEAEHGINRSQAQRRKLEHDFLRRCSRAKRRYHDVQRDPRTCDAPRPCYSVMRVAASV